MVVRTVRLELAVILSIRVTMDEGTPSFSKDNLDAHAFTLSYACVTEVQVYDVEFFIE